MSCATAPPFAAMSLGRQDLAGKTGTTSDFMDAWFCGYQPTVVGIAWIGFDNPHTLGSGETGGGAALPMWISYMGTVLKNVPQATYTMPEGMVSARINPSGLRDPAGERSEVFYKENLPPEQGTAAAGQHAPSLPTRSGSNCSDMTQKPTP